MFLHQFENKYNVELNDNGRFCCCDDGTCVINLADLPTNCSNKCDTTFIVSIAPCNVSNGTLCSDESTESGVTMNGPSFVNYGYFFDLASNQRPENVSCLELGAQNEQIFFTIVICMCLYVIPTNPLRLDASEIWYLLRYHIVL